MKFHSTVFHGLLQKNIFFPKNKLFLLSMEIKQKSIIIQQKNLPIIK